MTTARFIRFPILTEARMTKFRHLFVYSFVPAVLLLAASIAQGQTSRGTLTGRVIDKSG
jgi:hypothetical protein